MNSETKQKIKTGFVWWPASLIGNIIITVCICWSLLPVLDDISRLLHHHETHILTSGGVLVAVYFGIIGIRYLTVIAPYRHQLRKRGEESKAYGYEFALKCSKSIAAACLVIIVFSAWQIVNDSKDIGFEQGIINDYESMFSKRASWTIPEELKEDHAREMYADEGEVTMHLRINKTHRLLVLCMGLSACAFAIWLWIQAQIESSKEHALQ